jgi:hypothetical protein
MSDLLLCLMAAVGFSRIVTHGLVFSWARQAPVGSSAGRRALAKLSGCPQCSGFWTGFLAGLCVYGGSPKALAAAGAGSLCSILVDVSLSLADRAGTMLDLAAYRQSER